MQTDHNIININDKTEKSQAPPGILRQKQQALEHLWQQGISGRQLLGRHSRMIDDYLYKSFCLCPEAKKGFALLAIGGYGRQELFPYSDVDLLLLYAPEVENKTGKVAEAVLYPLWDAGLEVGHGVRSSVACLVDAEKDFFFRVALLDARLIAGAETLFAHLMEALHISFIEGRRREFLQAMIVCRQNRHQQFGQHSYMLEPHIKESRGGLRDYQAMIWTARVVFGLRNTGAMLEAGLLTGPEQEKFDEACEQLIKVRNRLHYISGRKNDRLYFEHQEEMAAAFGYREQAGILGVELFMRDVYSRLQTISITVDLFFDHVDEVLGLGAKADDGRALEEGIELRRGRIHLVEPDLLQHGQLLMRVFLQSANTGAPLHYRTRKIISANLKLLDDFRKSQRLVKPFLELLQVAAEPLPVLEAMLETGLLSAFIPEFSQVESLAQHEVYHVYTVDLHMLHTVAELHKLQAEMPQIFKEVKMPQVLFLSGLLHDIGKGRGREHAAQGAKLAGTIGERLGLSEAEKEMLSYLVRHHLLLPHIAQRRDLEDEVFLRRYLAKIQGRNRLAMLYLLTVADARATGPNAWNEWKAALLLELYLKMASLLDNIEGANQDPGPGVEWLREKIRAMLPANVDFDLSLLPADYLLSFYPESVVEHIGLQRQLKEKKVLVVSEEHQAYWSLLVMAHDRPGLLSRICAVLALHNLQILSARIFTWSDGTVVDSFNVSSIIDEKYRDKDWSVFEKDLGLAVEQRLGLDFRLGSKQAPLGSLPAKKSSRRAPKVVIDNQVSDIFTVLEVYAEDRIGLLYDITRVLSDFGVNIFKAQIGSRADQAVDVFYVLDRAGKKITDSILLEEIHQALLHVAHLQRNDGAQRTLKKERRDTGISVA